ncbi:hypothetical protein N500_0427 [Wolbachia pipientis wUni]|nr:hypothetical protein N500_0427 [Wolbachia pipientis wUni]
MFVDPNIFLIKKNDNVKIKNIRMAVKISGESSINLSKVLFNMRLYY